MKLNLTVDGKLENLPDGPRLPMQLRVARVIEWKGQLVEKGGYSNGYYQDSTYILNKRQSSAVWVHGPRLGTAREHHFSFLLEDTVYVGCGYNSGGYFSSVEMMNLSHTNPHWTFTDNYPHQVTSTLYS